VILEQLTGRSGPTVHAIGSGSQNKPPNQLTLNRAGGPVEATAIGSIL